MSRLNVWHVTEVPSPVGEWVEREVIAALNHYWTEARPALYLSDSALLDGDPEFICCHSGDIPIGPEGEDGVYTVPMNLLKELAIFVNPYRGNRLGVDLAEAHVTDVMARAARLRELAADIARIADEALKG